MQASRKGPRTLEGGDTSQDHFAGSRWAGRPLHRAVLPQLPGASRAVLWGSEVGAETYKHWQFPTATPKASVLSGPRAVTARWVNEMPARRQTKEAAHTDVHRKAGSTCISIEK